MSVLRELASKKLLVLRDETKIEDELEELDFKVTIENPPPGNGVNNEDEIEEIGKAIRIKYNPFPNVGMRVVSFDGDWKMIQKIDEELKEQVQTYINTFRNNIGYYLRGNIGQKFNVVSFSTGVMIELKQGANLSNSDVFLGETDTIEHAMEMVDKNPEDYDFDKKTFSRFKKSFSENAKPLDKSKIILGDSNLIFNGKDVSCWTEERAVADVDRLMEYVRARQEELKQKPK